MVSEKRVGACEIPRLVFISLIILHMDMALDLYIFRRRPASSIHLCKASMYKNGALISVVVLSEDSTQGEIISRDRSIPPPPPITDCSIVIPVSCQ